MPFYIHILIYLVVLSILLLASVFYNPRSWLHRMPPEVVAKVPARTATEKHTALITGLPFLLVTILYPIIYVLLQQSANFFQNFLLFCAFFMGFTIWDTLVLDLIIVCTISPRRFLVPGTNREDYRNKLYHIKAGSKGLVISLVFSAVFAGIITLVNLVI
ncbi:MAG TPA: hypothetical protein DIW44_14605 [Anaerolineaceae bacterium]|nr:hypothetical protein [Anaerolineaceae bacterium]